MAPDLSFEEKVDYIYKELKGQKRTRFLNFIFKISIIAILIFGALNIAKGLENDAVVKKISSTLGSIVKPIINDLVKDMDIKNDSNTNNITNGTINKIIENPELLNNTQINDN